MISAAGEVLASHQIGQEGMLFVETETASNIRVHAPSEARGVGQGAKSLEIRRCHPTGASIADSSPRGKSCPVKGQAPDRKVIDRQS